MKIDLHSHSTFSDGKSPFDEMLRAAEANGLKWLALTDHILTGGDTLWIEQARETVSRMGLDLKVLIGAEGVILNRDGDFSINNETIAELDIVLADMGFMTEGIFRNCPAGKSALIDNLHHSLLKICENPGIDIIAHPFNIGRLPIDLYLDDIPEHIYIDIADHFAEYGKVFEVMNQMCFWFPKVPVEKITRDYSRVIEIFKSRNVKFSPGSDAHSSCGVGNLRWTEKVIKDTGIADALINPETIAAEKRKSAWELKVGGPAIVEPVVGSGAGK
jgi:histidinol phosphatase-like PHP family hydrolase